LEQLEDEVFGFGDDKKGSLIFSATATSCKCPECGKLMKRFQYRAYDLELDLSLSRQGRFMKCSGPEARLRVA
jgi:hypothetical protein